MTSVRARAAITGKGHRAAEMPAEHIDLLEAEIDRLARGEGYGDEP